MVLGLIYALIYTDVLINTDAEGPGGCAALTFDALSTTHEACLLIYRVSQDDQARATGNNPISPLELFTVASALWSRGCAPFGTSVAILVDNDLAAEAISK